MRRGAFTHEIYYAFSICFSLFFFLVEIFGSDGAYGCDDDFSFRLKNQISCSFFALFHGTQARYGFRRRRPT